MLEAEELLWDTMCMPLAGAAQVFTVIAWRRSGFYGHRMAPLRV